MEGGYVLDQFLKLIEENKLPVVRFHSLRHLSTTVKMIISNDLKAVQGDTGHATAQMVMDRYAHILDLNRRKLAVGMEESFYQGKDERLFEIGRAAFAPLSQPTKPSVQTAQPQTPPEPHPTADKPDLPNEDTKSKQNDDPFAALLSLLLVNPEKRDKLKKLADLLA